MGDVGVVFVLIFVLISGIAIYLIPSIIASKADHPNKAAIIALNILGGWTFIVWVISLVWALSKPAEKAPQYVYIQENREPVGHQRVSQPSSPPRETRQRQHRLQEKDDDIDIDLL